MAGPLLFVLAFTVASTLRPGYSPVDQAISDLGIDDHARIVTMVCHDWGGLLGLRLLAEHPHRFRRVVASNAYLPTGDQDLGPAFTNWLTSSQQLRPFEVGYVVDLGDAHPARPPGQSGLRCPVPRRDLQGRCPPVPAAGPDHP